jgi:sugar phosphate isomerase/epimerase
MHNYTDDRLTRRTLLAAAAATLAAATTTTNAAVRDPYGPFKVGIQSYTLRHYTLDDALDITTKLGIHFWEAFPAHLPITTDKQVLSDYHKKLADHHIKLEAYGVVGFSNDEADARRTFDFARAMQIPVLSASPSPDSFALLDKLTHEYNIRVAIHNHGPGDNLYAHPQQTLTAIAGHSKMIGECEDTGHMIRSGEDPVAAAKLFGHRLYDVHIKAARKDKAGDIVWTVNGDPRSLLNTQAFLQTLLDLHYSRLIALEYEDHETDPVPYMKQCFTAIQQDIIAIQKAAR